MARKRTKRDYTDKIAYHTAKGNWDSVEYFKKRQAEVEAEQEPKVTRYYFEEEDFEYAKGGEIKVGDKFYSYENPDTPYGVTYISGEGEDKRYKLSLRDKDGYSYSSKNLSRNSLSKTSRKSDAQKVKNNKMTKEQFKDKWGSTMYLDQYSKGGKIETQKEIDRLQLQLDALDEEIDSMGRENSASALKKYKEIQSEIERHKKDLSKPYAKGGLTDKEKESLRKVGYTKTEIEEADKRARKGSKFAETSVNPLFNTYARGGEVNGYTGGYDVTLFYKDGSQTVIEGGLPYSEALRIAKKQKIENDVEDVAVIVTDQSSMPHGEQTIRWISGSTYADGGEIHTYEIRYFDDEESPYEDDGELIETFNSPNPNLEGTSWEDRTITDGIVEGNKRYNTFFNEALTHLGDGEYVFLKSDKFAKGGKVRTNSKQVREAVRQHILESVTRDDEYFDNIDDASEYVASEFKRVADYPNNMARIPNNQERFSDYLMGLPHSFYYFPEDMEEFLNGLGINPEGKKYSNDQMQKLYHYLIWKEVSDKYYSYAKGGSTYAGEDVSSSLYVSKLYDNDGNFMGYTVKDKFNPTGKYTLSSKKERAEENRQYLIDNPSRLAYYRKNEYAGGGGIGVGAYILSLQEDAHNVAMENGFDSLQEYLDDLDSRGIGYAEYDEREDRIYTHSDDVVDELMNEGIAYKTYGMSKGGSTYAEGGEVEIVTYDDEDWGTAWAILDSKGNVLDKGFDGSADAEMWAVDNGYKVKDYSKTGIRDVKNLSKGGSTYADGGEVEDGSNLRLNETKKDAIVGKVILFNSPYGRRRAVIKDVTKERIYFVDGTSIDNAINSRLYEIEEIDGEVIDFENGGEVYSAGLAGEELTKEHLGYSDKEWDEFTYDEKVLARRITRKDFIRGRKSRERELQAEEESKYFTGYLSFLNY